MNLSMNISIDPASLSAFNNITPSFEKICEVNQYNALKSVQNFPDLVFYLSLSAFIILFLYVLFSAHIKNIENKMWIQERTINASAMITTCSLYFITLIQFPSETTGAVMEKISFGLILLMVISITIQKVKQYKVKQHEQEGNKRI